MPSLDTLLLTDVRSEVSTVVFARGRSDSISGAVTDLARSRLALTALVSGSGRRPNRVRVTDNGKNDVVPTCDCPHFRATESSCRHIVAALLAWIDRRDGVRRLVPRRTGEDATAASYRRSLPVDPLDPLFRDERAAILSPLRPEDLASSLGLANDRWSWRVSLDGGGPGLVVEGESHCGPRGGVEKPTATYRIEPPHVPALSKLLRSRASVSWTPAARTVRVRRTPARLRLMLDEEEGAIVLSPTIDFPGGAIPSRATGHEDFVTSPDGITWAIHDLCYYPVARKADSPAEDVLSGRLPSRVEGSQIPVFVRQTLPALAERAGVVITERVRAHRILEAPALVSVRARGDGARADAGPSAGRPSATDWFWLDPVYRAGQYRLTLAEILGQDPRGGWLRRGHDWIWIDRAALLDELAPIRDRSSGGVASEEGVRVPRLGLLRASASWEDRVRVDRDEVVGALLSRLARSEPSSPAPPLPGTKIGETLRPYQRAGYDWLWWLRESQFGGILADEMGLGKTHEVMALLAGLHAGDARPGPSLVVCPRSVLDHWETKVHEYAPDLEPIVFHAGSRDRDPATLREARLVLTTYGILPRSADVLTAVEWEYVILDEAQKIKNPGTVTARLVRKLRARHRLAMTGTPIENRAAELWSIVEFLMPGYLGSAEDFNRRFALPIASGSSPTLERLKRAVRPFKLRRLKQDVLPDLPPKVEDYRFCRLSPQQAAIYREILARRAAPLVERLRAPGGRIDYVHIFAVLTLLKRLCDHPALVVRGAAGRKMTSGKFDAFQELLDDILDAGEKVVVFSQYLEMLDLIEAHLREKGVAFAGLRGKTVDRRGELRRFQEDPDCRVFVGSLLAGGLGIDLTAASVVVHYDRWWNAAREDQASDRVHRIGQSRGVQVWKLVTHGTIEERIDRIIRDKRALLENVVEADENAALKMLTRDDLIELLSPAK